MAVGVFVDRRDESVEGEKLAVVGVAGDLQENARRFCFFQMEGGDNLSDFCC